MGVIGRYLDLLPDAARERIHSAAHWGVRSSIEPSGARNLLGHAEDWSWPDLAKVPVCGAPDVFALRTAAGDDPWAIDPLIATRFARLVKRRGLEYAVSTVRARLRHRPARVQRVHQRGHLALVI